MKSNYTSTFSLVARDPATGNICVAGGSHWFSYGTIVPHIEAGVGAIATQAESNISYGPEGLKLLKEGKSALEVVEILTSKDIEKDLRQLIVIDNSGNVGAWTGQMCIKFASHFTTENLAIAGNTLANEEIIKGMTEFYQTSNLPFEEKVIKTLQKAQELGGDLRGKRSAAMIVVKPKGNGKYWEDTIYNLRIDNHDNPFQELKNQFNIASAYREMNAGDTEYFENKDKAKAVQHYENAYRLFPTNPEVKFWYAKLLGDMGEDQRSKEMLQQLFELDKKWEIFWERIKD